MADVSTRPNIRIEIKNNVSETMDVDEEAINISEDEEGEIIDKNEEKEEIIPKNDVTKSRDIWAKFDNGTTINTKSDAKTQIEAVYTSLNVKELRDTVRLDAIHMRGIGEMNTLDILKYFLAFSPTAIEWVDEISCNILWAEMPMAATALYHLSKAIVGSKDVGSLEETMDLDGQNTGMQNKHRIIEIKDDDKELDKETDKENSKEVHFRDVKEGIPEGSWRLGNESMKSKFILLRFALTTDKQPFRAEHFTEYYKQCGVIENGDKLGIISKSRKRKFQGIFDRNRDLTTRNESETTKNPWGPLAECWYQDYAHTEPEYKLPTLLNSKRLESISNLHHRLGFKRAHLDSIENDETNVEKIEEIEKGQENFEEVFEIRSDLEETIASEEHTSRMLLEKRLKHKSPKKKKSKIPRMRMYADEEEAKIKRKKSIQSLKKKLSQKKKVVEEIVEDVEANDLRNMLGKRIILKPKRRMENMVLVVKQEADEEERNSGRQMEDLGNKLKHRHLMRLSEAAAKNSVHLRLHGHHHTVSTSYQDEENYDVQEDEPEPESFRRPATTTTIRSKSTVASADSLIPRGATLHSDTITTSTRRSHQLTTSTRSPDRHQRLERGDRGGRDQHYQREARQRDRDRSNRYEGTNTGRMHSDREENDRRSGRRTDDRLSGRRRYKRDVEEEEIERVERKGAKSKVMIVVKKQRQPTVASMAILPRPSATTTVQSTRPTSISTSMLRHRRHDNVRLATRDANKQSSSSSSSEGDDSSSSSSSSSSDDDSSSDSESGSESESDSESSDSSDSEKESNGPSVVRGGRGSVKDRVGIKREDAQHGRLRVQIKNEHYGK